MIGDPAWFQLPGGCGGIRAREDTDPLTMSPCTC
jgi:hypothetical protein